MDISGFKPQIFLDFFAYGKRPGFGRATEATCDMTYFMTFLVQCSSNG